MADDLRIVQIATAMQAAGRFDEAEALYRETLRSEPRDPTILHALGILLAQQNRPGEAIGMIDACLAIAPGNAIALSNRGKILWTVGQLPEALAAFEASLDLNPNNMDIRLNRALVLQEIGRLTEACHEFEKCVSLKPMDSMILGEYANVLTSLGRHEAALEIFDRALSIAPRSVDLLNNRGMVLRVLRRYEEALNCYDRALAEMPQLPETLSNRGAVLADIGRLEDARKACEHALSIKPGSAPALNNLGFVLRLQGRLQDALDRFDQALSIDPNHVPAIHNKAKVLCDLDQVDNGLFFFRQGARIERRKVMAQASGLEKLKRLPLYEEQTSYVARHAPDQQEGLAKGELTWIGGSRLATSALRDIDDQAELERVWSRNSPRLLVLDNLLSGPALRSLQQFCLGSNIWCRSYSGGYSGAFPESGFACELLAQIAEEFKSKLPFVIGTHCLRYLWAFNYEERVRGTAIHADEAAININFWITPDAANADPSTGGLIVWDQVAPADWKFEKFNDDPDAIRSYLEQTGAKHTTIPYAENRAVIFDSSLFHQTDGVNFLPGYANRRINITMLFGQRTGSV